MAVSVLLVLAIYVGYLLIRETNTLENLALNLEFKGIPTQSSSYFSDYHAENAVNGKFDEEGDKSACSFTVANPPRCRAWWKLPLKKLSNVAYLQIHFRESTVNRHVGFSVYVFNDSGFVPPCTGSGYAVFTQDTTTCPDRVMNITVNRLTKGIALYNDKEPPVNTSCPGYTTYATIEVCEVQLFGCSDDNFGEGCQPCDSKCLNKHCHVFNGSCIYGCSNPHKKAPECITCRSGFYGVSCNKTCGKCLNNSACDPTSGACPNGCQDLWSGPNCKENTSQLYYQQYGVFYSIIANGILALFLAVAIGMIVFQRRRIASLQYDKQMFDHQDQGENKLHNYDNLAGLKEQHKYANLDSTKKELHYQVSSVL